MIYIVTNSMSWAKQYVAEERLSPTCYHILRTLEDARGIRPLPEDRIVKVLRPDLPYPVEVLDYLLIHKRKGVSSMPVDLRTIYTGNLKALRKHNEEINTISQTVHDTIIAIFDGLLAQREQNYVREKIAELARFEAQLADLEIRMDGTQTDSMIRNKVKAILDSIRQAQRRLERILSSLQNEANNTT